jgi:hypothetical protein
MAKSWRRVCVAWRPKQGGATTQETGASESHPPRHMLWRSRELPVHLAKQGLLEQERSSCEIKHGMTAKNGVENGTQQNPG